MTVDAADHPDGHSMDMSSATPVITGAFVRRLDNGTAQLIMSFDNSGGRDDVLTGVHVDGVGRIVLVAADVCNNDTRSVSPHDRLPIAANTIVVFRPEGCLITLGDIATGTLSPGSSVRLQLTFEVLGSVELDVPVK